MALFLSKRYTSKYQGNSEKSSNQEYISIYLFELQFWKVSLNKIIFNMNSSILCTHGNHPGRDRKVVTFTTSCAISAYHN